MESQTVQTVWFSIRLTIFARDSKHHLVESAAVPFLFIFLSSHIFFFRLSSFQRAECHLSPVCLQLIARSIDSMHCATTI